MVSKKLSPKFKHNLGDKLWVMRRDKAMLGEVVARTLHEGIPYDNIEYRLDFTQPNSSYSDWANYSYHTKLFSTKQALVESLIAE